MVLNFELGILMMKYGEKLKKILGKEPESWHFQKGTFFSDHPLCDSGYVPMKVFWRGLLS